MTRITMIGLVGLMCAGCLEIPGPVCASGVYCPSGQVCVGETCAPKDQVIACEGRGAGSACQAAEFSGLCRRGLCMEADCGNGYVDITDDYVELCDDGNVIPGDGCSADCQTMCGDGILDLEREVCDIAPPNHQTCLTQGYDMGALACDASCERADTSRCISFSWEPVGTMEPDWHIGAVWAFSSQNVYAVGGVGDFDPENLACFTCGHIFHYDGARGQGWQKFQPEPGGTYPLTSIWAANPQDIFVAGVGKNMWHYDGTAWTRLDTGISNPVVVFMDMWGTAADNVFAVYREYTSSAPRPLPGIIHFDGNTWNPMQIPTAHQLSGIWGRSADDVYIAGDEGIFHYDGNAERQWTLMFANPVWQILGVWGNSEETIAVGSAGRILRQSADTGGMWMPMESGTTNDLGRIWGGDALDFFAAGEDGTILRKSAETDEWRVMHSGVDGHILDLFGLGPADIFAVGLDGTALHCCGWEQMDRSRIIGSLRSLNTVGDECVYAVGESGTIMRHEVHGGAGFQSMDTNATAVLWDIWGAECDQGVFAVGDGGTILHLDQSGWSVMESGVDSTLFGVWGSSASNVFAVGEHGVVLHWNGAAWRTLKVPPEVAPLELVDVWSADDNIVFMVSKRSTLVRYERDPLSGREDWQVMPHAQGLVDVYLVWGASACDVWTAGLNLMHFQCNESGTESNWEPVDWSYDEFVELRTVWGSGWSDVFVGGGNGTLLHFDGTSWSPMRAPTTQTIRVMTGTGDGRFVYALSVSSQIYRLSRGDAR